MPKVIHVKKARKRIESCGIVIEPGESYYWWKFMRGPKMVSKEYPKPWQLTRSEFWRQAHLINHRLSEFMAGDPDDASQFVQEIKDQVEELRDETQDKWDNMPEGLQMGDTGMMLEERVQACDDLTQELEELENRFDEMHAVDCPDEPDDPTEEEEEEYSSLLDEYEEYQQDFEDAVGAVNDLQIECE